MQARTPATRSRLLPLALSPLLALVDDIAVIEHAVLEVPDPRSGHCVDDAGRALALACMMDRDPAAGELAASCLGFLREMHLGGGRFRLRDGPRRDVVVSSDDGSGRAIHGIGIAASCAPWKTVRMSAQRLFCDVAEFNSEHLRARAHAVIGAASAADCDGMRSAARALVDRLVVGLEGHVASDWPWPERRLTYGNGVIVEALLAAAALRRDELGLRRALGMLRWLVGVETVAGHLSSTPVGGWASDETRPGFDQQPIEAWTLADAAVRAAEITGDLSWGGAVRLCASWFAGVNDTSTVMWDPSTGRSFDGLHCDGVNRNQGAESALALLSTAVDLGRMRRLVRWPGQAARS